MVIYTSDIKETSNDLDMGDLKVSSTPVLLSAYNGDAIMERIMNKIQSGEELTHKELFELSLIPLMHSLKDRNELISDSIELAKQIQDERDQVQVIAGILTATDKFIDDEYAIKVKEWLKMTKVGRAFEEEKEEAVKDAVKKTKEEEKRNLANALLDVLSLELIAEKTGLSMEEVKEIEKEYKETRKRA